MRRPAVIAAVGTVLALLCASRCDPDRERGSNFGTHCQVLADSPSPEDSVATGQIVAKARFWCDRPGADEFTFTLRLQKRSGGRWTTVAEQAFTLHGSDTIRSDGGEAYRTRTVSVPCQPGVFRTALAGTSSAPGVRDSYDLTGPLSADPCRTDRPL
jgi:hypothetical protein